MTAKTQFKTDIVQRYKNGESSYQISKSEECSYNTVLRELKRRGVNTGLMFWTKKEIEKLKKLYPVSSKRKLLKEFPVRKEAAIKAMARKLGLKKEECKKVCKNCGKKFTTSYHKRALCSKCAKKQWEHNNLENGRKRKKQWIQRNPEYMKEYYKELRKKSPKYRLDCNIGMLIYHSLRGKKAGKRWENLVNYTLKDLMKHLEGLFDKNMTWENYGTYWHVDHIKPRSLFRYTSSDNPEFKKCWALGNLQPLEKIANLRKSNTFKL